MHAVTNRALYIGPAALLHELIQRPEREHGWVNVNICDNEIDADSPGEPALETHLKGPTLGPGDTSTSHPTLQHHAFSEAIYHSTSPTLDAATDSPTPFPCAPLRLPPSLSPTPPLNTKESEQPLARRTSHKHTCSARVLIKSLHPSIRDRARSLVPEPLPHPWTYPPHACYYIGDTEAFARLSEQKIEWLVTTGVLKETNTGLMWAAIGTYLLINLPPGTPGAAAEDRVMNVDAAYIRTWHKERYELDTHVHEDKPVPPIVGEDDPECRVTPTCKRKLRFDRHRRSIDDQRGVVEMEVVTDNEGKTPKGWEWGK